MGYEWINDGQRKGNRLTNWVKKRKWQLTPSLKPPSPSLSVSNRGQSAGRRSSQSEHRDRERGGLRRRKGAYLSLLLLLLPECFAAPAACRLTGLLRDSLSHSHTHTDSHSCEDPLCQCFLYPLSQT